MIADIHSSSEVQAQATPPPWDEEAVNGSAADERASGESGPPLKARRRASSMLPPHDVVEIASPGAAPSPAPAAQAAKEMAEAPVTPIISDSAFGAPSLRGSALFSHEEWERVATLLRFSSRELDIVRAAFDDADEAGMGRRLGISTHTVHAHLMRLHRKLGVRRRIELVLTVVAAHLGRHEE